MLVTQSFALITDQVEQTSCHGSIGGDLGRNQGSCDYPGFLFVQDSHQKIHFSRLMFRPLKYEGFQHLEAVSKAKSSKFLSFHRRRYCCSASQHPFTAQNFQQLFGNVRLVLKLMTFFRSLGRTRNPVCAWQ